MAPALALPVSLTGQTTPAETATGDEVLADYLDRLTLFRVNSVQTGLYEAARQAAGGYPLSLVTARSLLQGTAGGDTVLIATGTYEPPRFPAAEADGPPGAAALARVLTAIGRKVVVVSEPQVTGVLEKVIGAVVPGLRCLGFPGGPEAPDRRLALEILGEENPRALVSVEKVGRNAMGEFHAANGRHCSVYESHADALFDLAFEQGRLSMGYGDWGNEYGFGTIHDEAVRISKRGLDCGHGCGGGIISRTRTTYVFPCAASNFGAFATAGMMAKLLRRPELVHSAATERRLMELMVRHGVAADWDEATQSVRVSRAVDGIPEEVVYGVVALMEMITRRKIEADRA